MLETVQAATPHDCPRCNGGRDLPFHLCPECRGVGTLMAAKPKRKLAPSQAEQWAASRQSVSAMTEVEFNVVSTVISAVIRRGVDPDDLAETVRLLGWAAKKDQRLCCDS